MEVLGTLRKYPDWGSFCNSLWKWCHWQYTSSACAWAYTAEKTNWKNQFAVAFVQIPFHWNSRDSEGLPTWLEFCWWCTKAFQKRKARNEMKFLSSWSFVLRRVTSQSRAYREGSQYRCLWQCPVPSGGIRDECDVCPVSPGEIRYDLTLGTSAQ